MQDAKDDETSRLLAEIPHLRRYARVLARDPHAADDLVQSSLERAHGRFHLWRREQALRPWLMTIMHNLHVSRLRARAAAPVETPLDDRLALYAAPDARLDLQRVLDVMRGLPEDQRLALLLVSVEDMSYTVAAEVLHIPVGTLMSRLHRGREKLRVALGMAPPVLRRVK
ncbi:MAG: sigma-70 family RNA polymerase sigma factor [Beijerinckiaceae bacterium]|jgi:RNA polymerase sigma-70 factor (ECF subfamily)